MKKILAIALALVMIMSLAVFASAAETTLPDLDCAGWWTAHSAGIEVTEEGVEVTFTGTTYEAATANWNTPLVVLYQGDEAKVNGAGYVEVAVARSDSYGWTPAAAFWGTNGYGEDAEAWANWLAGHKAGAECVVKAQLVDGNAVIEFTSNGLTETYTFAVDTTKPAYISLSGEMCTLTNIVVTTPDPAAEPVAVEDGKYVIACGDLTFAAVAEDKSYGYAPAGDVNALTDADYVTITNVADGQFTMQDCYGRYIYMKGTYNSFNVSAEMPTEGYLWVLEETEGGLMLKNVEKEKYLAYSEQYSSWGCYPEVTANFVLTVTAAVTEEPAKDLTALLKFADADFYPATAGVCPTVITGPGTYTLSVENITATFGCGLDMAYMLYIEVADGYEALKDMVISDVKVVVDGEEIAVNQDFIWTYESLNTEFLPTGAYCIELYNALGYSGAGYGAAIDPNIFADESIVITFTMTDPNPNQPTGDAIFAVLAIFVASGMGLTAVVSKKR